MPWAAGEPDFQGFADPFTEGNPANMSLWLFDDSSNASAPKWRALQANSQCGRPPGVRIQAAIAAVNSDFLVFGGADQTGRQLSSTVSF